MVGVVDMKHRLSTAKIEQEASQTDVNEQVLAKSPCHAVEILGREDGPDEEMRSQHRASHHYAHKADSHK